ncbi:hypothetical protein CG723_22190 [Streptomyces sp. CB01635]|uniref:transposase n=1 Tax=Streptomyces sp. CB01635 TaxID=2020326 RepID=UPI000C280704|nr:hypothetical protein CG723_22190 [Streptomyces sp. CB01635]
MGSNYTKRYSEEFKRDAIALVASSGGTVTDMARELGIDGHFTEDLEPSELIRPGRWKRRSTLQRAREAAVVPIRRFP